MAAIPDEKVQEVRDRVDIVDLIGRYVELRRQGRNYKGLCPFHNERSPSFNVNPARKGYKCFGCGVGGDAIKFVMELEGKSFRETIVKLADMYGVHLPASTGRGMAEVARLATFFPSLLFSWLWRGSGSLWAPALFHAASNLLMAVLLASTFPP